MPNPFAAMDGGHIGTVTIRHQIHTNPQTTNKTHRVVIYQIELPLPISAKEIAFHEFHHPSVFLTAFHRPKVIRGGLLQLTRSVLFRFRNSCLRDLQSARIKAVQREHDHIIPAAATLDVYQHMAYIILCAWIDYIYEDNTGTRALFRFPSGVTGQTRSRH